MFSLYRVESLLCFYQKSSQYKKKFSAATLELFCCVCDSSLQSESIQLRENVVPIESYAIIEEEFTELVVKFHALLLPLSLHLATAVNIPCCEVLIRISLIKKKKKAEIKIEGKIFLFRRHRAI